MLHTINDADASARRDVTMALQADPRTVAARERS